MRKGYTYNAKGEKVRTILSDEFWDLENNKHKTTVQSRLKYKNYTCQECFKPFKSNSSRKNIKYCRYCRKKVARRQEKERRAKEKEKK